MNPSVSIAFSQIATVARRDGSGTFEIDTLQKHAPGGSHGSAN